MSRYIIFITSRDRSGIIAEISEGIFATLYIEAGEASKEKGNSFIVTCIGPDKLGILGALSKFLASRHVNIDDLIPGKEVGDEVDFGGLFGGGPIMEVRNSGNQFPLRNGRRAYTGSSEKLDKLISRFFS